MKKGISPVVAVVLLIAIAVIAAVGVWYWVGAYTGKPAIGGGEQMAMSITQCNGSHVLVRNIGGLTLSTGAEVYSAAGEEEGFISFNVTNLASGEVGYIEMLDSAEATLDLDSGSYKIISSAYPEYTFTCS